MCTIKHSLAEMPHYSSIATIARLYTVDVQHYMCRDDAFVGLESLEWLKLEDNSLTTLGGEGLFPRSLKVN